MVAMYVIFLGIIPGILLVLFLFYYSRHNVLLWWKKPRKSYVNPFNFNNKHLTDKFSQFQKSTSSLRYLLSFKKPEISDLNDDSDANIYENIDEVKASFVEKNPVKKALKKPMGKISKDDIHIANNADIKDKRPPVLPKPNVTKDNKPSVVIIKKGLESTTNEMVANNQHRMYTVGNGGASNSVGKVKVHGFKK